MTRLTGLFVSVVGATLLCMPGGAQAEEILLRESSGLLQDVRRLAEHPLAGEWSANLSKSKLTPNYQLQSATLHFAVTDDTVTATSQVVLASGQESKMTETFQTDGKEHPFPRSPLGPGVVVVARWLPSNVLETIATQNGKLVARATYEVSADGKTLIAATSGMVEQVLVFQRK